MGSLLETKPFLWNADGWLRRGEGPETGAGNGT
jgi:hypothetical protein